MPHPAYGFTRGRVAVTLIAITVLAMSCACTTSSTAPKTGSLAVAISTPAGITASILVRGPGGFSRMLALTDTLTGLAAGSYSVTSTSVTSSNAIVGTLAAATITGSPATVTATGAAASVSATYAVRAGSGGLWIANSGAAQTLAQYSAAQLTATTSGPANLAIGTSTSGEMANAVDADGNIWVTLDVSDAVLGYKSDQLIASGVVTPAVLLTANAGSLSGPTGIAVDNAGNLWVANGGPSTIVEYASLQMATSGSPAPAVTISATAGSLNSPVGIAFDAAGDLWAVNSSGTLVEFTPTQLAATGAPTPTVTIADTTNAILNPQLIAFDQSGNLWIAISGKCRGSTIVAFSPIQLATSGSPIPMITLSDNGGSLVDAVALAFDASGNLWVSNEGGLGFVDEFTASDISTSGAPTPVVTLSGASLSVPFGLAFDPKTTRTILRP